MQSGEPRTGGRQLFPDSACFRFVALPEVATKSGCPCPAEPKHPGFQHGNFVAGVFTRVPAKHTKNLSLVDILAGGVDRTQRNFKPMWKQVESWKGTRLPDESAKLVIYRAIVEGEADVPTRPHSRCLGPRAKSRRPTAS